MGMAKRTTIYTGRVANGPDRASAPGRTPVANKRWARPPARPCPIFGNAFTYLLAPYTLGAIESAYACCVSKAPASSRSLDFIESRQGNPIKGQIKKT